MPFTCEACGRRDAFPDPIPARDNVLRCPHCADEQPFVRPPLLIVTGAAGVGKSTVCARLAGTVPGAVLLDADVFVEDFVAVVPPRQDYPAFWRSMMRLAHELAQNDVVVVYFSGMLPEQLLSNSDVLGYFRSVDFLCLTASPDVLRARLVRRGGSGALAADGLQRGAEFWIGFNGALAAAANALPSASAVDAGRAVDEVAHDVRDWINSTGR